MWKKHTDTSRNTVKHTIDFEYIEVNCRVKDSLPFGTNYLNVLNSKILSFRPPSMISRDELLLLYLSCMR